MGRSYAQHANTCRLADNCHFIGFPKACGYLAGVSCALPHAGPLPTGDQRHHRGGSTRRHPAGARPASAKRIGVPYLALLAVVIALLLAGGVAVVYLARRRRLRPLLRLLALILRRALSWLSIRSRQIRSKVQGTGRAQVQRAARGWPASLGRRRASGPRAQVIRAYVRFVEQADREGVPRRSAHTAAQYEALVAAAAPLATEDLHHLTMHFMEARYSRRAIDAGTVPRTLQAARQVIHHLRRKT